MLVRFWHVLRQSIHNWLGCKELVPKFYGRRDSTLLLLLLLVQAQLIDALAVYCCWLQLSFNNLDKNGILKPIRVQCQHFIGNCCLFATERLINSHTLRILASMEIHSIKPFMSSSLYSKKAGVKSWVWHGQLIKKARIWSKKNLFFRLKGFNH